MRRGVLAVCVLLGCSFDSSTDEADSVLGESTGMGLGTTDSSTGELAESGASSATTATTTTSGVELTTSQSDPSTTTATSSASYDPPSSSTGDSETLSDDGLVARYFLDEAADGTAPMLALDSADEPVDLPLSYGDRSLRYVSAFGHRGLAFDLAGADDGARAPIAGSKFEGIEGVTALTFEVVVRLDDSINSASRIVHFGGTDSGIATLSSRNPDQLQFAWNDNVVREWDYSAFSDGAAHVVHVITDTNAVNDASRFRLLVDGNELPPTEVTAVAPGEAAFVPQGAIFALGNRNQDRAMQGILFYAAIYGLAFPDATVAAHVPALLGSDDSPR